MNGYKQRRADREHGNESPAFLVFIMIFCLGDAHSFQNE